MKIRKLDQSYKQKVIEIFRVCFDYSSKEDALYLEDESIWEYIWGMEEKGQLIATYMSIPTKTKIRGRIFEGRYVDGVATMPYFRKGGLARRLFLNDVRDCRKKGIEILLLDPFKHDFYRQMGFEVAFDNNHLKFGFELLSPSKDTPLEVINGSIYENDIVRSYVERGLKKAWEKSRYSEAIDIPAYTKTLFMRKELKAAIAVDDKNVIRGFFIYSTSDREMKIPRFWFEDLSGLNALKVFLCRHREQIESFSMTRLPPDFPVDLLLHSAWQGGSSMQFCDRPSRMLRLLDIGSCLNKVLNNECSSEVTIRVTDPVLKSNNRVFIISGVGATETTAEEDLRISVSDLAPLLTGRVDATTLWRMGKIQTPDQTTPSWHDQLVPDSIRTLEEFFPAIPTHSAR